MKSPSISASEYNNDNQRDLPKGRGAIVEIRSFNGILTKPKKNASLPKLRRARATISQ